MLRVRVAFNGPGGSPWLATHYFLDDATQVDANNAVAAVGTFWGAIDARMANSVNWATESEVAKLNSLGQKTGTYATTIQSGTGALAGSPVPLASQGLIRWHTGTFFNGREIRGRTFVPGITLTDTNTSGGLVTTTQTIFNNAAAALVADATTVLVIFSKVGGGAFSVANGNTWAQFATMRSRRD